MYTYSFFILCIEFHVARIHDKRSQSYPRRIKVWVFVGMQQLGSHWTDFHEIWYLRTFMSLKVGYGWQQGVLYIKTYVNI
jgi:hypothetical protein